MPHPSHQMSEVKKQVSIVVLHYNGLQDTRCCLESLLRNTHESCEIIILDNGSQNHDALVLEQEFGSRALVVRSEVNRGYAGGNNLAARIAVGEFLVLLNNDTEVSPGWLEPILAYMRIEKDVAACQPKLRSWDDPTVFDYSGACGGYLDALGYPYMRGRLFDHIESDRGQYDSPVEIDWACGACMVVRRNLFLGAGGFDERFFAYMEEVDLCHQLRKSGKKIMCIPSSVIYHKGGRTWANQPWKKCFHRHRNSLLFLVKNAPFTQLTWKLPIRLCMECIAAVRYLCVGEWRSAWSVLRSLASFTFLAWLYVFAKAERKVLVPAGPTPSVVLSYYIQGRRTFMELASLQQRSC